jgi:succinate dehydrogenase/fumarate reductase-like Fe-S protein
MVRSLSAAPVPTVSAGRTLCASTGVNRLAFKVLVQTVRSKKIYIVPILGLPVIKVMIVDM